MQKWKDDKNEWTWHETPIKTGRGPTWDLAEVIAKLGLILGLHFKKLKNTGNSDIVISWSKSFQGSLVKLRIRPSASCWLMWWEPSQWLLVIRLLVGTPLCVCSVLRNWLLNG